MSLKDCYVTNKYIWILRGDGAITRINPETNTIYDSLKFNKKIVSIGKSINDTIYAADENGSIFRIFDNRDTNFLWNTNQIVQNFVFTSVNKCFLIVDKGIYEPENARLYYENAFSNGTMKHFNTPSWEPSSTFIDKENNIWLGFSAGEWGGDIIIFSTDNLRYIKFRERQKDRCYVRPVRSFFQTDSTMYAVTSLQHMSSINSSIIEITDTCRYFFESPVYKSNYIDDAENLYKKQEIYMGPAVFNNKDNSIYFYSQFGIFKGNIKNDLGKLENWHLVLKTKFMWHYGMPDAVGYGMNVSKMFFEANKFFVVSPDNGILVWDGKGSVLLKTTYKPPKW
jgi:outer membrane protein assembly factor BamB